MKDIRDTFDFNSKSGISTPISFIYNAVILCKPNASDEREDRSWLNYFFIRKNRMCKLPQRMFFLKYLQKGLFEYKPEDNSFWYLIKKSYILWIQTVNNVILSLVFTNDKRIISPWKRPRRNHERETKKKLWSLCLRRGCFHVERRADIVTFVVTLVFPLLVKTKFNWRVLHTNYNKMVKIALRKSDRFIKDCLWVNSKEGRIT